MFWLRIENNVFSCKNRKLGLKKSSKGGSPLIFRKIIFSILFDIITPLLSQRQKAKKIQKSIRFRFSTGIKCSKTSQKNFQDVLKYPLPTLKIKKNLRLVAGTVYGVFCYLETNVQKLLLKRLYN